MYVPTNTSLRCSIENESLTISMTSSKIRLSSTPAHSLKNGIYINKIRNYSAMHRRKVGIVDGNFHYGILKNIYLPFTLIISWHWIPIIDIGKAYYYKKTLYINFKKRRHIEICPNIHRYRYRKRNCQIISEWFKEINVVCCICLCYFWILNLHDLCRLSSQ